MTSLSQQSTRISITVVLQGDSGLVACFPVDADQLVDEVKAMLEANWGVPMSTLVLSFQGRVLNNHERLNAVGVAADDLLHAETIPLSSPPMSRQATLMQQACLLREQIRSNNAVQAQLRESNPSAVEAALNNDPAVFQNLMLQQQQLIEQERANRAQRVAAISADPFNEDHQRAIEEEIRQANIQRNLEAALEHNPEAFTRVCMLYVNLRVNNKSVTAFVDSGAQSTIMTFPCAERLGIAHLIDRRYQGIAKGVGTTKICGRIHYVEIQLGTQYLAATLTILEGGDVEFLWGLDMLKKHRMSIDLEENCLRFGEDKVQFLQEQELPDWVAYVEEKKSAPMSPVAISAPPFSTAPASNIVPAVTQSSASRPSVATSSNSSTTSLPLGVKEADVATLVGLGFTRQQSIQALQACHGNVDMAAGMLFQ